MYPNSFAIPYNFQGICEPLSTSYNSELKSPKSIFNQSKEELEQLSGKFSL